MLKQKKLLLALIAVAVAIVLRGTTSTQPAEPLSHIDNNQPLHISKLRVYQPVRLPAGYRTVWATPFSAKSGKETAARLILLDDGDLDKLAPPQRALLEKPNSFRMTVRNGDIELSSADRQGLIYGLDELTSRLELTGGKLYTKSLSDAPDHAVRALHLVIRSLSVGELRELIDRARKSRFNTLIIQVGDFIRLDARAVKPRPDALSKEQFSSVLDYASDNGFAVIPEVKLLTKQNKFFKASFPELLYNELTYDPREPKVYELVFEYLDEVIELFDPSAVHIGHDEVSGTYNLHKKSAIRDEGRILPPELFLRDVIRLHDYLQS
ncbi:MAG: family 20 glycosylhydrolase, partial [Gammaproteobacteria bacterium]|nr:family 20 glycosylhydrolase [Gammaproteobacteria bacterium]